jgi:hypothetical protein
VPFTHGKRIALKRESNPPKRFNQLSPEVFLAFIQTDAKTGDEWSDLMRLCQ